MKKTTYFLLLLAVCFCGLAVQAKSVGDPVNTPGHPQHSAAGGDAFSRWVLGEPVAPPPPTTVCINEIDANTPGTDVAEYIELSGTPNGALDGFIVVLFNGANDLSYRVFDLDGFSLDANGFFLIGNPGVAGVDITFPNTGLQNGADAVAIYDTSDFVIFSFTTTVNLVDAIVYDNDNADDMGLLNGLGQTVQYNENQNNLAESQSISRSTDCGSTIVTQNITPNATNGGSTCPSFPSAPANVSISNSTCNPSCVAAGGLITAPPGSPCPAGSSLQYQVNSGSWSGTLPIYDQDGPAQSIKTRCSCDSDAMMNSAESAVVTTVPANCTDLTLPTITCPGNIPVANTPGLCSAVVSYTTPVGTDNCTGATTIQTLGLASGATYPVGPTTNIFKVTDASGNTATCAFAVSVTDIQLPTITCPANIAVANASGLCSAVVSYSTPVGTDNCSAPTTAQTAGLASGASYPVGATINRFVVTDGTGNTNFCAFTVTVSDTQLPTITCPANITSACSASLTYITPVGADNCSGATTIQTSGLPSGSSFPGGVTTNTFKVTDASNNTATCAFTVTISDTELPTITCPGNIPVGNTPGLCGAVVSYTTPVGTDNCSGATTIQTLGLPSGANYPTGPTTNIFKVTDAAGNTATCAFAVSVTDIQLPTITCPANISVSNAAGLCSAVVSYSTPVGTDNCSAPTTTQTAGLASGATYPVGQTINRFQVTDGTGNTNFCAFTVTVNDTELPTFTTCPGNIPVANTPGLCGAVVSYATPVGADNCSGATTIQTLGLASGATYPVGPTTNIFKVTDAAGNTATCAFAVSVTDTQLPTITCPANISVSNTAGLCSAVVSYTTPVGTDNCSAPTTTQTAGLASGATYPVGATINRFVVTDGTGNTNFCAFTVTVSDTELPAISCPGNIALANTTGLCSAIASYTAPVGTDNCSGAATIQTLGLASGASYPVGATTNIFKVTDAAGNTATCAFAVSVTDTELPTISCPANIAANNTTGLCSAVVNYTAPAGTDNCSGSTTARTAGQASGSIFPVGVTTNTFTVTAGNGQTAACSFTVTVTDTELPTISCPANIAANNTPGLCSAVVSYATPVGTDNCSGATTARTAGLASGAAFPRGVTTNTFTVTSGNGQTAACSFTVTVTDNQPPVITCPTNQNIPANTSCSGLIGTWTPASVSDNCTASGAIVVTQTPTPATVLNGHNAAALVTLTANDGNGNTAACSFTVTLKDVTLPVALCKNITANLGSTGTVTVLASAVNNGSSDNCSFSLSLTPNTFTCLNIGMNTVTLKATDAGGNTATCIAKITVKDVTGPNARCKNPTIFLDESGHATLSIAQVNNGSSDACGISTMSINHTAYSCGEITGTNPVILSLTDVNGNASSCLAYVTVKDAIAPTAICKDVTVHLNVAGKAVVYSEDLADDSYDNCSVYIYNPVAKVYTTANLGPNNLTITVKDFSGNASTCVSVVTVEPFIGLQLPPGTSDPNRGVELDGFAFNVYPNPTSGDVFIAFELPAEQPLMLRIFDLQGRMVLNQEVRGMEGENTLPLRLGGFAPGMYLLDFQSGGLNGQRRLVVQE